MKKAELNLVEASGALNLKEAFEKSLWQKILEVHIQDGAKCDLCNQPIKVQIVIRNLRNGLLLKVGSQCHQKMVNFMQTGDFLPIPKPTASGRQGAVELRKLAVLDETYLGWFDAQILPDDLRKEIEHIKAVKIPTSLEKVNELVDYYRHHRVFEPHILLTREMMRELQEMNLAVKPMTLIEYDLWLANFNSLVCPLGKNIYQDKGWYKFVARKNGLFKRVKICRIAEPEATDFNKQYEQALQATAPRQVKIDRLDEGFFVAKSDLDQWLSEAHKQVEQHIQQVEQQIREKLSVIDFLNTHDGSIWYRPVGPGNLDVVIGDKATDRFVFIGHLNGEQNPLLLSAIALTIQKPLNVYYCQKTDMVRLSSEDIAAWNIRQKELIEAEREKVKSAFSRYDVTFTCPSVLEMPDTYIAVPELGIWVYRRRLHLTEKVRSRWGDMDYDYFTATVEITVPADKIGYLIGRHGTNVKKIAERLGREYKVRHLKVEFIEG